MPPTNDDWHARGKACVPTDGARHLSDRAALFLNRPAVPEPVSPGAENIDPVAQEERLNAEQQPAKRLRVGLVGWLLRGNFGDDLMAVMFALELMQADFDVVVWGLSPQAAAPFGITTVESLDALECCDALIYAGGGLLTLAHTHMEEQDGFGTSMRMLCTMSVAKNLPLMLLSIGGDGQSPEHTGLSETQCLMLRTAKLITVRNPQDVALVKRISSLENVPCFADIVWRVKRTLRLEAFDGPRSNVLVHQSSSRTWRLIRAAVSCLNATENRLGAVFNLLTQFEANRVDHPRTIQHRDILQTLAVVSKASLLISARLHLAMSAMVLGTPVLSVNAEAKTKLMLQNFPQLAHDVDSAAGRFRFPLRLWKAIYRRQLLIVAPPQLETLADSAAGHSQAAIAFLSQRQADHAG